MRITAIYDNGGKTLDRYTVLTDEPYYREDPQGTGIVNCLGLNEGGDGFSQWSSAQEGRHLGKRVKFEDLSAATQKHIATRVFREE